MLLVHHVTGFSVYGSFLPHNVSTPTLGLRNSLLWCESVLGLPSLPLTTANVLAGLARLGSLGKRLATLGHAWPRWAVLEIASREWFPHPAAHRLAIYLDGLHVSKSLGSPRKSLGAVSKKVANASKCKRGWAIHAPPISPLLADHG